MTDSEVHGYLVKVHDQIEEVANDIDEIRLIVENEQVRVRLNAIYASLEHNSLYLEWAMEEFMDGQ